MKSMMTTTTTTTTTGDTETISEDEVNHEVVSVLDDENLKQQSYLINSDLQCDTRGKCPPIDIEFVDLTYTVPAGRHESKVLLRGISGLFKSNQLTAIMGSSGAGKSTLLNVLAGYKTGNSNGNILINGYPRNLEKFRKLSRYIMQEDLLQPNMTVFENMKIACHLKLGTTVPSREKYKKIFEIMDLLRLKKTKDTMTNCLSGGEKKRLCIALELINDPPIIFLDEPTTGLDDVASAQCISLLKTIAKGGRTVICSIHTPSARIFSTFDHVYIMADGQCAYAGLGEDVVTFLSTLSLNCPTHYNPADFVIEVLNREYGDHTERMIMAVDNGRVYRWNKPVPCYKSNDIKNFENFKYSLKNQEKFSKHLYNFNSSGWLQFNILLYRMFIQSWHDKAFILLKVATYILVGIVIGSLYFQFGNDASKTIFNFGFFFCTNIVLMYIPLLPVLLNFPMEVQLLKREYFNRWYGLNAYFCALTFFRTFLQVVLSMFYVVITYVMTDQPLEFIRIVRFCVICIYVAIVSESFGYVISSQLNVVNSIFVGPAMSVPFMLLAVYGMGTGSNYIPVLIRIGMYFSYLRYGLEGMVMAVYGDGRQAMECPPDIEFCQIRYPDELMKLVGMENVSYWFDVVALTVILVFLKILCYFLLRMRLSTTPSKFAFSFIGRFVKTHFTVNR